MSTKIPVNYTGKCQHQKSRFVCISDTHGKTDFAIPDGDVLSKYAAKCVCATFVSSHFPQFMLVISPERAHFKNLYRQFSGCLHCHTSKCVLYPAFYQPDQPIDRIKIITGGNHDHFLDDDFGFVERKQDILALMEKHKLTYLEHEMFQLPEEMGSLTMFVSPYAPIHLGGAFMLDDMSAIWDDIPPVDILVTHTPPYGYGDKIVRGRHVGCQYLRDRIDQVIQPKVSVCGHIHEAHGYTFDQDGRLFINASLCDHRYRGNQLPITFDL